MTRRLILLTNLTDSALDRLLHAFGRGVEILTVYDRDALAGAPVDASTSLLSFGSGVIVPADVLARFTMPAYNMHAASPDFPGRDPHHHAVYRGATNYGATLHLMTARVDEGPIVGVETFPVTADANPESLLAQANEAGMRIVERLGTRLLESEPLPALPNAKWGPVKTRRVDLHYLCKLTPLISEDEFARRLRAFERESHSNLTVDLHGQAFRIDQRRKDSMRDTGTFSEFTEAGFRNLLRALNSVKYHFARYGEDPALPHVLWRHDVDFSMHRAAKLALIEQEEGAHATYFLNPHSTFYNLLEPSITALARRIADAGHDIGLHFDASAFGIKNWVAGRLEEAIGGERRLLETIVDRPIKALSWHNPDESNLLDFADETIGGLVSSYSDRLKRDYIYVSDSNGYWRYRSMVEVIAEEHPRLHLLTHPGWWAPEPMSPSDRVDRAILGRARRVRQDYDDLLKRGGRRNVT